jgi:hypothetical protein
MPIATEDQRATVRLHVPVVVPRAGVVDRLSMANWPVECRGKLVGIDANGMTLTAESHPSEVTFEWTVGGPECRKFRQFPPFVLEGDAETVRLIERIFQEGSP